MMKKEYGMKKGAKKATAKKAAAKKKLPPFIQKAIMNKKKKGK